MTDAKVNEENTNKDNNNQSENNTEAGNDQNSQNQNAESKTQNPANESENGNSQDVPKETVSVLKAEEKLYITPLINSLVINTLEEEKQIEIVSEVKGWSYIQVGTIVGWVRTENIQKKEIEVNTSKTENNNNTSSTQNIGYISGTSVNFRKTPNTSGEVITKLSRNTKLTIIAKGEEWTQVECNGNTGYVSNNYISDKEVTVSSRSSGARNQSKEKNVTPVVEESQEVVYGGTGTQVIEYAKKYLGYRYTSGGSTPSRGFDCSGFTTYVYRHFGISLSRTSSGQSSNGVEVKRENLQAGDIICFSSSSGSKKIGHVGLYIGGGKFIHAANSRKGVIISRVSGDGYYFVTARRVI